MNRPESDWYKLSRQNTGRALCDSGDFYGRQYEKSIDGKDTMIKVYKDGDSVQASISLPYFLGKVFTIGEALTDSFYSFADTDEYKDEEWSEVFKAWALTAGMSQVTGHNSYNHECDLNQTFQWHTATRKDDHHEPYGDNAIYMVQTHNGCDVRGGYSSPLICRLETYEDWCNLNNWMVGWYFVKGQCGMISKIALTREQLDELQEPYSSGYSQNPTYRLNEHVARVLAIRDTTVKLLLDTGEIVYAVPEVDFEY